MPVSQETLTRLVKAEDSARTLRNRLRLGGDNPAARDEVGRLADAVAQLAHAVRDALRESTDAQR